jgi:hypothetical protein
VNFSWLKYKVPAQYVSGTIVPEPNVSLISAEVVSMAGVVTQVTGDKEWKMDCSPPVAHLWSVAEQIQIPP